MQYLDNSDYDIIEDPYESNISNASNEGSVREVINNMFKHVVFTYIENVQNDNKSNQIWALWIAKIHNMLGGQTERYIILFVPQETCQHMYQNAKMRIYDLDWKTISTRTIFGQYRLQSTGKTILIKNQRYELRQLSLDIMLAAKERTLQHTKYKNSHKTPSFDVLLLHNPKKRSKYQHPNNIYISSALLTFQCIVSIH